jgi:hypothetical protein
MNTPFRRGGLLLSLSLSLVLAACGGGGGGADTDVGETIDTAGRLAIAEDGAPSLRLYDLDSAGVAAAFTLANPASAVYASPGRRYALAFQRAQDTVQAADGGIWQEDHGDHLHDYKRAPRLLPGVISGAQPTHYDDRAGQASIFMDGRGSATPPVASSAVLLTDASLAAGTLVASVGFQSAMHGFAEPSGEHLIASWRDPAGTDSLPTHLEVYRRQGTGYSFVERLGTRCSGMHGSYSRAGTTLAGCSDGVLLVKPQGTGFVSSHVPLATGVGTIAGHPKLARFVAFGNAGTPATTRFHDIDAAAGTGTPLAIPGWAEGRARRAHGFDRHGRLFFVLDDAGTLHAMQASAGGWTHRGAIAQAVPAMPSAAPFPAFAANEARDEIYLTDPVARQIVVVNTVRLEVSRRLPLDFRPSHAAWVGIAR